MMVDDSSYDNSLHGCYSNDDGKPCMKILLICYEFCYSRFSGNGILAASLVSSLLRLNCRVTVWCCRPSSSTKNDNEEVKIYCESNNLTTSQQNLLTVIPTKLSEQAGWKRLDSESGWKEFVVENLSHEHRRGLLEAFDKADAITMIDWTGGLACRSLLSSSLRNISKYDTQNIKNNRSLPILYLNFRVYSSGVADVEQHQWYDEMEHQASTMADSIVALSEKDRQSLKDIIVKTQKQSIQQASRQSSSISSDGEDNIDVLLPCLRGDMQSIANQSLDQVQNNLPPIVAQKLPNHNNTSSSSPSRRRFLVPCVVRLSPEKDTIRFVTFCQLFHGWMERNDYTPLLAGACSDPVYAKQVQNDVLKVCPNAIVVGDTFLSPQELAAIFSLSVINFHPCAYEAYGMTIIEAAVMGTPSIVNGGGQVGATALLDENASIQVTWGSESPSDGAERKRSSNGEDISETTQNLLEAILEDKQALKTLGQNARTCAMQWDESAYGKAILDKLLLITRRNGLIN